jgi:hypothetical protein
LRILPPVPNPGKGENRIVCHAKIEGGTGAGVDRTAFSV